MIWRRRNPSSPKASVLEQQGLDALGRDPARAMALLREAAALAPEREDVARSLGIAAARCGRLEEAAAAFGRAAELVADDSYAHEARAEILTQQGKLEEAAREWRAVLGIAPSSEAQVALAGLLEALGHRRAARSAWSRFARENPASAIGRRSLLRLRRSHAND